MTSLMTPPASGRLLEEEVKQPQETSLSLVSDAFCVKAGDKFDCDNNYLEDDLIDLPP